MIVIYWILTVLLWIVFAAFFVSDVLCVLALAHHWKDVEFRSVLSAVVLVFALFAAGAAYAALSVGRCL